MDRRKSLKLIATSALAGGAFVAGCKPGDEKKPEAKPEEGTGFNLDRNEQELVREKTLQSAEKFFTPHEMATITVLADYIIPKDEISGSASDAKVPEFIEFIVHDMPNHQVPMRGGLRWLDMQCLKKYQNDFKDATGDQQKEMLDAIAYPEKAKPEMAQGVSFFNLMRNLTATGFFTSQIGVKDLGYAGNKPNQWNGVPDDVLKQYGMSYTEKDLKDCVSFDGKVS